MESMRFDALTRTLTRTDSRRGVLRGLATAGLGVGLGVVGLSGAEAKRRNKKKKGHKGLTQFCQKSVECKGDYVCKLANSQHYFDETEKRCCIEEGDPCDQGYECCGVDVICNGGYCQSA